MRKTNQENITPQLYKQKNRLDVSVIVVNWNTCTLLRKCLKSVYDQAGNVAFEVIVVDNASTDGSCDMVRESFDQVKLIANERNRGYATALNQGMRIARGRYFLALNSDILICDGAIEKTVAYADKHSEAAVVGCQVYEGREKVQMTCFRYPSVLNVLLYTLALSRIFRRNRFFGREWMLWWKRDSKRQVDVVSGMFMLVRKEAVEQVGLMDESFFFFCEETDWCYRFSKAGWKMIFWPGGKVIHAHGGGQSRKKDNLQMMVQFQKSMLIFFKKHYSLFEYLLARLLLTIYCGIRFVAWGFLKLCKTSIGKDATRETMKMRGFWESCKFCVLGHESKAGRKKNIGFRRRPVKGSIEFVFALFYSMFLALMRTKPRHVVLYYHSLKKEDVATFERQMKYLAKRCCVVKPSEIMTSRSNGADLVIGITFDDAFASIHDNALPILQKYKLPAAVFVPTGNLARPPKWLLEKDCADTDEIVMSKEQVAQLDRAGFEVFSHTVFHQVMTEIEPERVRDELIESKRTLEDIIGHEVAAVSYPHGSHGSQVCSIARQAGYKIGFTVEPSMAQLSKSNLEIGRFAVSPDENFAAFKLKVHGGYQATKYLRSMKRFLRRSLRWI